MLLWLNYCTFRRYIYRYEEQGIEGLYDKWMRQASHRRAPADEVMTLERLYSSCYQGFNVKHFYWWYRNHHNVKRSYDRGSHYWQSPEVDGKVDKTKLTQFGRGMKQLSKKMIPSYSPEAGAKWGKVSF